jgi:outer membrane biosynthesis protein TonB
VRWTVAKKKETPKPEPGAKPRSAKSKPEPKEKTVADTNENQSQQNQPKPVGGPADDTSVRGFADKCKELAAEVMSGDYMGALQSGKTVLSVGFDLLGLPNIFGAQEGAGDDTAKLEDAKKDLEAARAKASAPQSENVAGAAGADAKAIPPELMSLIMQLAMAMLNAFLNRRKPTA